ncbi:LPXTG cell wall anchor domain-containing protein [Lactobacillus johnsonii]|nr:LPXTG cell wall anchor domain-containing protein [Lactobacillus johnsonii]UKV65841.1 LPXTG cell wall anchor domain-containing protein [Lactobacillus johnsonii]
MSESLSNSVSTSESLSNSVSMNKSQSRSTPNNSSTQSTSTDTLQPKHKNAESVDKAAKKDHRRGKLPQTGAESNSSFLGLMIAALGGLLGFRRKKRKDEDKD